MRCLRSTAEAAVAVALVTACGGGGRSPSTPSGPVAVDDGSIPAGAAVLVVDGETGAPVPGAHVVLGGTSLAADANGQVALPQRVPAGTPIDILAPETLDRQTLLRNRASLRLTLWPRSSSTTGLDEHTTATLVYTLTGEDAVLGAASMRRPLFGQQTVTVTLSAELQADPEAVAAHEAGVALLTAATGGQVSYLLGPPSGNTSSLSILARYDPSDTGCGKTIRGFAENNVRNGEVVSTRIVYCVPDAPKSSTVHHELGHAFGLRHSPHPEDLMYRFFTSRRRTGFSPRETLAMSLMLQRRGENRFPDDDRATASGAASVLETAVCR